MFKKNQTKWRFRDLGFSLGRYPTGIYNAITDVPGVKVGHTTLIEGSGNLSSKKSGPVRTGVTAIIPNDNIFMECVVGGSFILNGAGEVSGLTQVTEWGMIESPILLTNTFSVGTCSNAVISYLTKKFPKIGQEMDVVIPLVGECDDSWLNNITGRNLKSEHIFSALNSAASGFVEEGNVGGGTGMITCDFKGGIGTSSRKLSPEAGGYTIGVLVMSNFGDCKDLRVDGVPVGQLLEDKYQNIPKRRDNYGSIIAVIATDSPISSHQLNRLSKRATLGIGRVGSYAAHGSGEIVLAFSTANKIMRGVEKKSYQISIIPDKYMDPLYEAVIEATEEAIINALCAGESMYGMNGHFSPRLPLEDLKFIMSEYKKCSNKLKKSPELREILSLPKKRKENKLKN